MTWEISQTGSVCCEIDAGRGSSVGLATTSPSRTSPSISSPSSDPSLRAILRRLRGGGGQAETTEAMAVRQCHSKPQPPVFSTMPPPTAPLLVVVGPRARIQPTGLWGLAQDGRTAEGEGIAAPRV